VNITFQSRDWNPRNAATEDELHIVAAGVDLDHDVLTVYTDEVTGDNLTLAVKAPYQNENGDECGNIAWRIEPSELLREFPELAPVVGFVYGRVIVTELRGDMAVDKNRNDYVLLRDRSDAERQSSGITVPIDPTAIPYGAPKDGETGHVAYVVVFSRDADAESITGDPQPVETVPLAAGVKQMVAEIQEGYDVGGMAGHFQVVARISERGVETVEGTAIGAGAARKTGDVFTVIVRSKDGRDLTPELASHPSIDGAADKARQGKPLGSLANLDADNALAAVCQIIDQGHEWTTGSEDVVQPLRDAADQFINHRQEPMQYWVTPDGWQVYVFRFNEEVQS
jgi:hypothetical protein